MKLFEPKKIGILTIKNRIIMLPMRPVLLEADGSISQRAIDYYVARAKGGVGAISTSLWMVERALEAKMEDNRCVYPMADGFTYVDRISQLVEAVHDYGTKIFTQMSAGFGRILPPWCYSWQSPRPPIAPSAQPWFYDPSVMARELTRAEIKELVKAFGTASRVVKQAGVDAIELQGVSGYLMDQFMTSIWNRRTDEYGCDLEGRLRFVLEIINEIKTNAGSDFPVIFRYSLIHGMPGGREIEEGLQIAQRLEKAGVDALSIVIGCQESKWGRNHTPFTPQNLWIDYAAQVKEAVKIPVIAAGRLGDPVLAEEVLKSNKADFIGLGRGLLADPEWPNKVREGRLDEIITCIACGDGCQRRTNQNKYVSCALNPVTGMEREFTLAKAEVKKSVLVIGGGPGGMEAARVARLRGHDVTLWEKTNNLGGNLIPASVPDFKQDLNTIIKRMDKQIHSLGVKVELNKEATPENVKEFNPEVVFVATGSTPIIPRIPGINNGLVTTATDVLQGKKQAGDNVVVVGGGSVGAETALYLAQKGKKVTIVEMMAGIASEVFDESRKQLLRVLTETGVIQLTETKVIEIAPNGVSVDSKAGRQFITADTIVLALGLRPETDLADKLTQQGIETIAIGDCVKPRKIMEAIWEGFRKARVI